VSKPPRRRYWDAACFIAWLGDEPERVPSLRPILREAEAGNLVIVTSVLTLTEVLWNRRREVPSAEEAEEIEAFFDHEYILLVNLDRDLASRARRIIWERGVRPKDAVHVASALEAEAEHFDTFDDELIMRAASYPIQVGYPNVQTSLFD